jgi:hypothetical protein
LATVTLVLAAGIARGATFQVRATGRAGTFKMMATPVSAAIFLIVLLLNEFEHVFRHGDPSLGRATCSLLVLSAGSSIAVNAARAIRGRMEFARANEADLDGG